MSVNPIGGGGFEADIAAVIAEEIASLAADARTLGSMLSTGDVVNAVVLPSNGLTDLLDIGGLRVAAELPPTVLPGQTIAVMVTGFSGDRINLLIVPPGENAPALQPKPTSPCAHNPALLGAPKRAAPRAPDAEPKSATTFGHAAAKPLPRAPDATAARPPGSPVVAPARAGPSGLPTRATPALKTIEARLAAAHATTRAAPPRSAPAPAPAPLASRGASGPPNAVPTRSPVNLAAPRFAGPPPLARAPLSPPVGRSPIAPAAARIPGPPFGVAPRSPIDARRPTALPPPSAALAAVPRGPAAFAEPSALLRALRLPLTATNIAAARMALETPERLPTALAALESALAKSAAPGLETLRALTTFVARLDPRSPVLSAQVAAFADHLVMGPEAKLAQLARTAPVGEETADRGPAAARAAAAATLEAPAVDVRAAVVRTALDYDLKTQLLTFAAGRAANPAAPGSANAAELERAVAGALTAITALQLSAASSLAANPDGLAFALPVALPDGFARAHVHIDRDAPNERGTPLDGDDFHIAFILETRHLGTVAIDLVTVGRAVTFSVKTEAALAQRIFGESMARLSKRLESLRYTVAAAEAVVAPRIAAPAAGIPAETPPERARPLEPGRRVDFDA